MKKHTYATEEEISSTLSQIIPNGHSVMGYSREEQIDIAMEVARRTGKSLRINAMQIHPSTPISFGEKIFRAIVVLVSLGSIAVILIGLLVALATSVH